MATVNRDYLNSVNVGFRRIFNEAMAAPAKMPGRLGGSVDRFFLNVDSKNGTEEYHWKGFPAPLTQWVDQRIKRDLIPYSFSIPNLKYQTALEVEREALEDDQLDQIKPKVQMLAWRVQQFKEKQLATLINNGFSTNGYDGQYFFSGSHAEGDSGAQDNVSNAAFSDTNLKAAILDMMGWRDDAGEPLGIMPDALLVSQKDYFTARQVLESTTIVATGSTDAEKGSKNTLDGMLDLYWSPYLNDGHWGTFCTNLPVKPFIWQDRIKAEFVAVTNPNDSEVFETDVFKYGVRQRSGAGYGLWQLAWGSNN